jgi:hypothetical protein
MEWKIRTISAVFAMLTISALLVMPHRTGAIPATSAIPAISAVSAYL